MAIQTMQVILEPMATTASPKYFYFDPGVIDYIVVPGDYPARASYITSYAHLEATLVINSRANSSGIRIRTPQQVIKLR